MKAYEVWGPTMKIASTCTTRTYAEGITYRYPMVKLKIKEVDISFMQWFTLKLVGR